MILGRDPSLWLGAVTGVFNVAALFHVFNITADQLAGLDALAGLVIALVAGKVTNHAAILAAQSAKQ